MKKFLLTIAAVVTTLVSGSGIAWADTAWVYYNGTTSTQDGFSSANMLTMTAEESKGFKVAVTGTGGSIASASDIKVDGTARKGIKTSGTRQNTLYIPNNYTVNKITLYSYVNNSAESNITASYWKEVNKVSYEKSSDTQMSVGSGRSSTDKYDTFEFSFADGVKDELTFTGAGKQLGYIMKVEYTESAATEATKPTVSSPKFDFAQQSYTLTITGKDGESVKYQVGANDSVDANASSVTIQISNGQEVQYWAVGDNLKNSTKGTYTAAGLNEYSSDKAYVAWVYQSGYKSSDIYYSLENDPLYTALTSVYNIVPLAYSEGVTWDDATAGYPSLTSADLVVLSEAMAGNKTLSNSLVNVVGQVPVIGMKAFNYTPGRWSWGTPSNQGQSIVSIAPSAGNYKLFEGLTVENGEITLFDNASSSSNHIQTVTLNGDNAPADAVTLGNVDGAIAIHSASKYVLLGLSSDDIATANANAQQLIKNAAALLLAEGNDVTVAAEATELGTVNGAKNNNYATFYSETAAIIPSGVKAYIGKLSESGKYLNLEEIVGYIPAKTAVILEGEGDIKLESTIYTIAEVEGNDLQGFAATTTDLPAGTIYTLATVDGVTGLYKYAGKSLNAGKAFLVVTDGNAAPAIRFNGVDTDEPGNVTAIETISVDNRAANAIYDLRGRRVVSLDRPGLYIINGKKVAVK